MKLIPYKYTKFAHFSSIFLLLPVKNLIIQKQIIMAYLNIICYIFTNLHWSNLKRNGLIRQIDILIVLMNFSYSFFVASYYNCYNRYITNCIIVFFFFTINSILDFYTIYKSNCSNANYIRSVLIHCFFCHIYQGLSALYVTNNCYNYKII